VTRVTVGVLLANPVETVGGMLFAGTLDDSLRPIAMS